jgi:hypothetical protein
MYAISPTVSASRERNDEGSAGKMNHRVTRRRIVAWAVPGAAALVFPGWISAAWATTAPKDALLYFIFPHNGARIKGAFWCRFGLRNMGVTHAGDNFPNSGHHHLLVDVAAPLDPNDPIPADKNHLHFGAGQTEARIELPRGKHTLQLVLGDANHVPFNPPVISKKITVTIV